jgi:glycosyltransferase involved in cell wall biosynthesis
LRAIKFAYRRVWDRGQQTSVKSNAAIAADETDLPLEFATQDNLLTYTDMAAYVTEILRPLGPRAIMISIMEEATIVAWLASMRTPVRYVAWLHTVESLYLDQIFPNPTERQEFDILLQTAVARSEKCIFPSRGCCDDLASLYGLPADHFQIIYNPIDLAAVSRLGSLPPEKSLTPDAGFPTIVSLGRLAPEKNHEHLLKALALLQQRRKDFLCLIIGEGDLFCEISARIEHYMLGDNVRMLGSVRNPFPYLFRAKALALTSKFESFAVVLIEALASGATPVAVDCPTGPREVLDDGRVGILVPTDDEYALADAIETALWRGQDSVEVLTCMADRVKLFDIAAVTLQWEQLIEGIF